MSPSHASAAVASVGFHSGLISGSPAVLLCSLLSLQTRPWQVSPEAAQPRALALDSERLGFEPPSTPNQLRDLGRSLDRRG